MSQSSLPFPLVRDLEQPKVPRRWYFCPAYIGIVETRDLFVVCKQCDRYAIWCCQHRDTSRSANSCHHYRLAYVDGACSSNGAGNASAGLGVALGNDAEDQFSIDVSDVETNVNAPRTSQRAELLAAVQVLKEAKKDNLQPTHSIIRSYSREDSERPTLVIASDSEYVVRGITEWFPSWKMHGWRNKQGKIPANLDLFLHLDACITSAEQGGIDVSFCWIPRELNVVADTLARRAAKNARVKREAVESLSRMLGGLGIASQV